MTSHIQKKEPKEANLYFRLRARLTPHVDKAIIVHEEQVFKF